MTCIRKKCRICYKYDYFSKLCRSKSKVYSINTSQPKEKVESRSKDNFTFSLHSVQISDPLIVIISLNDCRFKVQIDTGADVIIIPKNVAYKKIKGLIKLNLCNSELKYYNANEINTIGIGKVEVNYENNIYKEMPILVFFYEEVHISRAMPYPRRGTFLGRIYLGSTNRIDPRP